MSVHNGRVRVLYSFPHKLGAERICETAWQQVYGLAAAGAEVLVCPGVLHRPLPDNNISIRPTLSRGRARLPYKLLGRVRTLALHDSIVANRLKKLAGQIDIVHTWPLGALKTLRMATSLGIPAVLERPNAHTQFAYEVVAAECKRIGVSMPSGHEHTYNPDLLKIEEQEYRLADWLLCPSDFVAKTFVDKGFPRTRLARHQYGYDDKVFHPPAEERNGSSLTMLFVGGCAPRKGLHFALEAWLQSSASKNGTFKIAGGFIPGYAETLSSMLSHPSVQVLGHRKDVAELMRTSDILVLPSIEEGSALVTSEARGSGCVLLVSEGAGAICTHMENALVHTVGDVAQLTRQLNLLDQDRALLHRLRTQSLSKAHEITWKAAGVRLLDVYRELISNYKAVRTRQEVGTVVRQVQSA